MRSSTLALDILEIILSTNHDSNPTKNCHIYLLFSDNGCTALHHHNIFSWHSTIAYVIITNGTNSNKEVTGTTTPFFHAISLIYSLSDSVALLVVAVFFPSELFAHFLSPFGQHKNNFFVGKMSQIYEFAN